MILSGFKVRAIHCKLISAHFLSCSSLAIGTKTGYRLFSLSSVEQLDQVYENSKSVLDAAEYWMIIGFSLY